MLEQQSALRKHYLMGNATCNDGSPAGYYLRRSIGSQRWIVFLEGGWYCYDDQSCNSRWNRMQHLMSSKLWPEHRNVGGILSTNPEENPHWWNANHVFLPYCTSDSWTGRRITPTASGEFSFMGAIIIEQVIRELIPMGLANGTTLILAGSSAGGAGVMLNLEEVQNILKPYANIQVRGISDSGWFLDRAPYSSNAESIASVEAIKKGLTLWNSQIPNSCKSLYVREPWRCFFGYRLYSSLKVPLFVFQWLFDEAQMTADNVGAPVTKQQWDYVHKMGDSLRNTFKNVTSVFAPSCISHSVLTKRDWQLLRIDDVTLPQALHCWELNTRPTAADASSPYVHSMLADTPMMPKKGRKLNRSGINNGRQETHNRRKRRKNVNKSRSEKRKKDWLRRNNNMKLRSQRQTHICRQRLIERCSWPQCNQLCPKLHNPYTGEEMDFIELLKSFGLDMGSVASALGIDVRTLNNMDHAELINLLTQQAN
ncbi:palmitoleoyl-protein carboxylesterase notum isoform X2 [Rhodnius prolixus]